MSPQPSAKIFIILQVLPISIKSYYIYYGFAPLFWLVVSTYLKKLVKIGSSSPIFGMNIKKSLSCHHLVTSCWGSEINKNQARQVTNFNKQVSSQTLPLVNKKFSNFKSRCATPAALQLRCRVSRPRIHLSDTVGAHVTPIYTGEIMPPIYFRALIGVITPFIAGRGPPCSSILVRNHLWKNWRAEV